MAVAHTGVFTERRKVQCKAMLCVALLVGTCFAAEPFVPGNREPQWPLKTSRTLLTDEQVNQARRLCETNADARRIRDAVLADAAYWLTKSDEELRALLPDGRVPRAFNVSTEGCPVHGKSIYKGGFYPWILDRDRPFTIICPEGGERYPSNDFEEYYRSGMTDESLLSGAYADSGRGWMSEDGEKYWLVGYACHWNWMKTWLPAVTTLSRAFLLTGDRQYARKAIAMLDRIAEVYPGMDYSRQSRYAELVGPGYRGKILNAIWETGAFRDLAIAYDGVFDALVGDDPISLPWRDAEAVRANIEANLLEEGIEAVARGQIRGNFGMHQSALAHAVVVRQHGPTRELLDRIFTHTGGSHSDEGLNYALYNLVFKDGMPYESSPGYCSGWVNNFVTMADALAPAGIDLFRNPKLRLMFDAQIEMICAGGFTPAIGDAGSITAGWIGPAAGTYEAAFRHLRRPRYAWVLEELGALKDNSIDGVDDLFEKPIDEPARTAARQYHHRPASRVMDGYGLAVLNNPRDSIAVSMYYGTRGGHGHFDRLNIELFAYGRRMSPDLGYPDFMNAFVPGIYSWSKNTISHNCLVVDRRIQSGNVTGRVLRLHDSPTVHAVDVSAAGTYAQVEDYRRTLVLVDIGEDAAYLVDVLRVQGGDEHVLSLHGAEGEFSLTGAVLSPPVTEGTLAGADVDYGQLYDDPVLGKPGYKGGFGGYRGSGYQHFFNWQQAAPEKVVTGTWTIAGVPAAQLRVHVPPHSAQEVIVADAYVSPTRKIPAILKYMLLRRSGASSGHTFVVVWEPAAEAPLIERVEMHGDPVGIEGQERVVKLSVHRGGTIDRITIAPAPGHADGMPSGGRSDALITVVTEGHGKVTRAFAAGGSQVVDKDGATLIDVPVTIAGRIVRADYASKTIEVSGVQPRIDPSTVEGLHVRLFNSDHSCIYRIAAARWRENETLALKLAGSDVFTGRVAVTAVDREAMTITTSTGVLYPHQMAGMCLVSEDPSRSVPIKSMNGGLIHVDGGQWLPRAGHDVWIADMGVGDRVEIERWAHAADQ